MNVSKPATKPAAKPAAKPAIQHEKVEGAMDAGAEQRHVILAQIDTGADLYENALVEGIKMTVKYGKTSPDEVAKYFTRCASPSVYASNFNRGFKVQLILGTAETLALIDKLAAGKGAGFPRVNAGLSEVLRAASESGKSTLTRKEAAAVAKRADAKARAPKQDAVQRGPKAPDKVTLAKAAIESGAGVREMAAAVKLMSQQAHRLPIVAGKESAMRAALAALADAAEKWAILAA